MSVLGTPPQAVALRLVAVVSAAAVMLALVPTVVHGQQDGVAQACPVDAPEEDFADRDDIPSAHLDNVDCAAFFEIVLGFADGEFRPSISVRRDQMASFIARTLDAADVGLPAASEGQDFDDVTADNPHRDNIRRLEAAGIVQGGPLGRPASEYGPGLATRRDQMTSLIIRAGEHGFDDTFSSSNQQFDDVPSGNVHFENINFAAENGIVLGFDENTFGPDRFTRRDQMASFTVRLLNFLATPAEVAVTDQSAETATVGETITVTASVFTQYGDEAADVGGDASVADGTEVGFEAAHADDADAATPQSATVTTDGGEAEFSFTSPETGTVTVTASIAGPGGAFAHAAGDSHTVEKDFVVGAPGEASALALQPGSATNPVDDDHTVTATTTDADGEPVDDATVRFEVYRDGDTTASLAESEEAQTGGDGTAELTYTGPSTPTEDTIVACVLGEGDDPAADEQFCAETTAQGAQLRDGLVGDEATKHWVDPGTIAGRVATTGDVGVPLATVTFEGPTDDSARTGPSGEYQSGDLVPGDYTVGVSQADCDDEPRQVTVEAGEDVTGVDFANCTAPSVTAGSAAR